MRSTAIGSQGRQTNYGLYVTGGTYGVTVDHGSIEGVTNAVFASGSEAIMIGGSRIAGGTVSGIAVTCAGNYNESYAFFANTCP